MRNCLKLFLLSLIFLASVIIGRSNDVAPNVVLIMTDDQGWGDLGSHGNEFLDTPNLDRLAAEGITFERFIVSPMCAPTRASLLTGRYNLRAGTSWVSHGKEILRLNEVTLGEVFSAGGYATGCFGKWHNGEYGRYHPNDRGFQEFFGFCRGAWENYFDPVLEHNRKPVQTQGYITDVLTDAVLAFIENNQNRPFFCYVPYNAPHHPYQVPERYLLKYAAKGLDEKTACVYGMVENIDDNVARILAKLRELDIQKQSLVIFLSDNGPTGVTRYNGGMRGKKATVDEGGVRVPGTFYWPGRFEAGRSIDQIVAHMDLFPTLVELCNLPSLNKLPLDGMSLMPLLNGTADSWPDRMIFTHQNRFGDTLMTPGGLRTQRYRLVNRDDRYELYDMVEDPGQKIDIANRLPDLTNRLAKSYEKWYQEVTLLGVTPPPLPVGYPTDMTTALQAEDAQIKGKLKFRRQQGWAHDSVLNWSSPKDSLTWKIDVQKPGSYAITLMYGCFEPDLGGEIQMQAGTNKKNARLKKAHNPDPFSGSDKDRNSVWTSGPVPEMTWVPLEFTPVSLEQGETELNITASGLPADSHFEVKEAQVKLIEANSKH